jgi:hypothetical protein
MKRFEKNLDYLSVLRRCKPKERRAILQNSGYELIKTICECCENVLNGSVPLCEKDKKRLAPYKAKLRELRSRKKSLKAKKQALIQRGGFLPALLGPLIGVIGGLLPDLIAKIT